MDPLVSKGRREVIEIVTIHSLPEQLKKSHRLHTSKTSFLFCSVQSLSRV